ncbi:MAG: DUF3108 domain-containing protein, partial [Pseudomonadota bacterium]
MQRLSALRATGRQARRITLAGLALLGVAVTGPGMGGASALRPVTPGAMLNGSWTLSLGGLTAARMEIDGTSDAGRYAVEASIQTAGVVRPFWKAGIDAEVEGAVTALARHGGLAPRRYRAKSSDADLTRHIAIDYPAQRPRVKIEPAYDKRRWALDPSNQTDALDPLSAMLSAFGDQPVEALCGREIRVFDARRLYAVTLEPATATPD